MEDFKSPYFFENAPSWGSNQVSGYGDSSTWLDEGQPNSAGMSYGDAANGFASGFSAGQANGQPNGFTMDNGAVWKGAGQGAASGFAAAGPLGGFIGAVTGAGTSVFKQDKALKEATNNINTNFNQSYDGYGRPVYNSQGISQGLNDFQALQRATQPGRYAMRPRRRRQMMRKSEDVYYGIQNAQQNYNMAEQDYRNQALAQQSNRRRLNDNSPYYNLFRFRQ